jgi:DNA-binding GntR family transcriptional regulator
MKALTQADLDYLEHQLARLTAGNNAERIDADLAFHARLYELSGFPPLQGLWPQMEILTRKFLSMSRRLVSREKIRQNHRGIMQALVDRDSEALEQAIKDHMRQTSVVLSGRTAPERKPKPGAKH